MQGEQTGPDACQVWAEREDGEIIPVVWPAGYLARLGPLELLDAAGAVVAVPGTPICVGGGLIPVVGVAGHCQCGQPGCEPGGS